MKDIKKEKKRYIIKPSVIDGYFTFWAISLGLFFIAFLLYGYNKVQNYQFIFAFLIALSFKLYIYNVIDLSFTKQIILTVEGKIYIKLFFFNWKVNVDNCYLILEDLFVPTTIAVKDTTLMIYRNNPKFINRLFKNKIKLHKKDGGNIEKIKIEAKKISELFGIEFRDIYEENM